MFLYIKGHNNASYIIFLLLVIFIKLDVVFFIENSSDIDF